MSKIIGRNEYFSFLPVINYYDSNQKKSMLQKSLLFRVFMVYLKLKFGKSLSKISVLHCSRVYYFFNGGEMNVKI